MLLKKCSMPMTELSQARALRHKFIGERLSKVIPNIPSHPPMAGMILCRSPIRFLTRRHMSSPPYTLAEPMRNTSRMDAIAVGGGRPTG